DNGSCGEDGWKSWGLVCEVEKQEGRGDKGLQVGRENQPNKTRPVLVTEFPRHLNSMQRMDMEADVTIEEIKNVVWDCGTDKSPGPDGFSFDFYRRFWSVIQKDVVAS
nr:RNA-directed DNA polymerase, eukaryota, reverse transcriptase zinc-binding domain protein [Tanacetum cinerariifolium]